MPLNKLPSPKPGIKEFANQGVGIGIEEVKRLINRRSRARVPSIEEKRKDMDLTLSDQGKIGVLESSFWGDTPTVPGADKRGQVNIWILDLVTNERMQLQNVPRLLDYEPTANWAAIAPIARNNPFYHYTGGEDTLRFNIDWFSDKKPNNDPDEDRIELIRKCRWMEAKLRNDGFDAPPHAIQLLWEDTLWINDTWVVQACPYKLSNFHKGIQLMPQLATQEITLKRVTDENRSLREIMQVGPFRTQVSFL